MVRTQQRVAADTATRVLDVAEELVQRRGFNGFSYADVAAELKITTATLHYHFPGKAELGRALISRYAERFFGALSGIEARYPDASSRLQAYVAIYAAVLRERRLCLCGMLAAEYDTLSKPMRDAVIEFFDENEIWLARVLEDGRQIGELRFSGSDRDEARMILSGLEGAMLVARPYGDVARFQSAANCLIAGLRVGGSVASGMPLSVEHPH